MSSNNPFAAFQETDSEVVEEYVNTQAGDETHDIVIQDPSKVGWDNDLDLETEDDNSVDAVWPGEETDCRWKVSLGCQFNRDDHGDNDSQEGSGIEDEEESVYTDMKDGKRQRKVSQGQKLDGSSLQSLTFP